MDSQWIRLGFLLAFLVDPLSVDFWWIPNGYGTQWISHCFPMDSPGVAMDALWVPLGFPILVCLNGPSQMEMEREASPTMDIENIEREGHASPMEMERDGYPSPF